MTSSDNLASIEPWIYRPSIPDSWISEAFARDTETLTKALQKSLSDNHSDVSFAGVDNPVPAFSSPAATTGSGSDHEPPLPRRRSAIPATGGKTAKRKSRASKRTTTTYITANPDNFRQMVQQVTGVRFAGVGGGHLPVASILKPEPQRPMSGMQGCLPTLDTSAFLLEHHQTMCPPSTAEMAVLHQCSVTAPQSAVADGGPGFDFETFSSFPTLESWKVM